MRTRQGTVGGDVQVGYLVVDEILLGLEWGLGRGLWGGDVQVRYLVVDEILLGLEWGLGRGMWVGMYK